MLMLSHDLCLFTAGRRTSLGSCCCCPSSLSSLGAYLSSSYQDLAKHIVNISIADVRSDSACPRGSFTSPPPGGKGEGGKGGKEQGR